MSDEVIHEEITKAIKRLSELTGEDFHGYRSEVYNCLTSLVDCANSNKLKRLDEGELWQFLIDLPDEEIDMKALAKMLCSTFGKPAITRERLVDIIEGEASSVTKKSVIVSQSKLADAILTELEGE